MAEVNLRLRGGPYDGQRVRWDVPDGDSPPQTYDLKLHGPHEGAETFVYQLVGRDPDGEGWIYEAPPLRGQ
ncbi:hypothetical protein [Micromonospora mirobrigensis]|uniref:Uncharacterized protein n=1 Tax=Micromonospora mirobrigensis TaxID=262898 RepID=A0A1C4WD21_9ACTN|nr:hypothetical protein [Micromonospora mirobrigensis]SCE94147.1 hypothetical protein GA0070564_102180 [Micromonospora mirobrigensis]